METKNLLGLFPKLTPLEKAWILFLLDNDEWIRFYKNSKLQPNYEDISISQIGFLNAYKAFGQLKEKVDGRVRFPNPEGLKILRVLIAKLEPYVEEK